MFHYLLLLLGWIKGHQVQPLYYSSVPGKCPLLGKCPCTTFLALSPGSFPAFQCYSLKSRRAWCTKSHVWRLGWKNGRRVIIACGRGSLWRLHAKKQDQQGERWAEVTNLSIRHDFTGACHTWSSITGWTHSVAVIKLNTSRLKEQFVVVLNVLER